MADFDEIRGALASAQADREAVVDGVANIRERLRAIAKREVELNRVFSDQNEQLEAERRRLSEERARAEAQLASALERQTRVKGTEAELINQFAVFTDPRREVTRLRDDIPILLMPVRLETRFKTTIADGVASNQLWVRIYPDDCWVDSFDPLLTENEATDAKTYWIGIWKAGGIEDQERAAWRTLAGSHSSGRAGYILSQFQPLNLANKPAKQNSQDVILTIATQTPLAASEETAAATFWRDAWLADGNATKTASAQTALETAVGQARAAQIIAEYQPVNFADPIAAGFTRDQVNVSVATVIFGPIDTKQSAWSRAPRINILPERFIFVGFIGGSASVVQVGNTVPPLLTVGPDPSAPKEEQIRHDENGNVVVPDDMKWMTDFDRAVENGMGLRIPLNVDQAQRGFDRVIVLGLRFGSDPERAKTELETLFKHHSFSAAGFSVVTQGTPTNNTEAVNAGFDRFEDPDESFDDLKQPLFTTTANSLDKKDGQWIAEYLGIDPALFANVHNAGGSDQLTERAMNIALWPATLGYWMESMMAPVFTRNGIEQTRDFFNRHVVASGAIPAIRIGSQPYGILASTVFSRMQWLNQDQTGFSGEPTLAYLRRLYPILLGINSDWTAFLDDVSFVSKPGDPHKILLDIIGLHPGSVEWSQRYAESLDTVFNRLNLLGFGGLIQALVLAAQHEAAHDIVKRLAGAAVVRPLILDKVFSGVHNELSGGVVDDKPLSETLLIRSYTEAGQNYIQWLIEAAQTSFDALYQQTGFKDDKLPTALLFILLRHALQLGYHDVSIRAGIDAGVLTAQTAAQARIDNPFLHIRESVTVSESRYEQLYAVEPAITGNSIQPVHEFITGSLANLTFAFYLRDMLAALERLKIQPTARLERAFADHVDCCSYRLDPWLLGIVNYQLSLMRNIAENSEGSPRQGIYLGAYAWLENVKPENKILTPVVLRDPDLITDFGSETEPPLVRDSTNEGFIHAPSLNQAVAAAVLRNGFISNASPENRQTMAINLTSERVRTALTLLEGIRAGQGLADLLGYQFERGLHDRHGLAEVDQFILKLRRVFPLRADHLKSTQPAPGVSIEAIEARNVIDGLALVQQMKTPGNGTYPFGKEGLPTTLSQAQLDAINAEAERLVDSHDAVADLALSEGVYQAVLGNYDRAASTYDAFARAQFPPEPDIIRTPLNGIGLTHRVGLHLRAGADPNSSPVAGVVMTPRAQAEPALNEWLASVFPPLDQVACEVTFKEAASGLEKTNAVTLLDLELQPADLIAIIQDGNDQAMGELDDRITRHAVKTFGPRPDAPIKIQYFEGTPFSIFKLLPLVRNLRRLTTRSRALKATDLTIANEATSGDDSQPFVNIQRLQLVHDAMVTLRGDLATFQAKLEGPLSDLENRKGEILSDADQYVDDLVELLARSSAFVVAEAGWGFAYEFRSRVFATILRRAAELVTRWNDKLTEFNTLLAAEAALPATATDAERFDLLRRAEQAISTVPISPLTTPAALRNDLVNTKQPAFVAKHTQFVNARNTTRTKVTDLLVAVKGLLPVAAFDPVELSFTAEEDEFVLFTQDAVAIAKRVIGEFDGRLAVCDDLFTQHDDAADAATKVELLDQAAKALLGEDFRIFPEFLFSANRGDEFENALNASRSKELFKFLTNPTDPNQLPEDFPVDTWLYGVARVREKMYAWEQTMMFAGALGQTEPQLEAIQLPFIPDDRWLGLEFPPELKLDRDRLLYTAHFAAPFNKAARQCGLLLDEWNETIPASDLDTGITFHHDRPNCEAPQAMLLVTPSAFRGAWQFQDLLDAINETFDLAKQRAIEPRRIDQSAYAPLLPATIMASQFVQLTIAANLALNNAVVKVLE
jgi:hypothetical protein